MFTVPRLHWNSSDTVTPAFACVSEQMILTATAKSIYCFSDLRRDYNRLLKRGSMIRIGGQNKSGALTLLFHCKPLKAGHGQINTLFSKRPQDGRCHFAVTCFRLYSNCGSVSRDVKIRHQCEFLETD